MNNIQVARDERCARLRTFPLLPFLLEIHERFWKFWKCNALGPMHRRRESWCNKIAPPTGPSLSAEDLRNASLRAPWLARCPEKTRVSAHGGQGCIMNSLINYQEAGSNLIRMPATRRAFLCPCWNTSSMFRYFTGSPVFKCWAQHFSDSLQLSYHYRQRGTNLVLGEDVKIYRVLQKKLITFFLNFVIALHKNEYCK